MSRVLLISYPGYPASPAPLVANPWLAHIAGALLETEHEPLCLDYGSVSMMRRLFPGTLTCRLQSLLADAQLATGLEADTLAQLQELNRELEAYQKSVEREWITEVVAAAQRFRPDLILLEFGDGDGFRGTIALAAALRERFPDIIIAAGGRKALWFRQRLLRAAPALTAVMCGDPEDVACELADVAAGYMSLDEVAGLVFREGESLRENSRMDFSLDDLAPPVYEEAIYPACAGDEKIKLGVVIESRGCNNRCAFCVHPFEDGLRQRRAPAKRVVDIMAQLQQRYGMRVFRLGGASTPGDLLYEIAQEILRRGLRVQYSAFGHFRTSQPEYFRTLARSGLYSLFFGLESGSQRILDKTHKGVRLEHARTVLQASQAAGIFTAASLIVPLPFDTPETLQESLAFVKEARPDAVPLQFPGLMPGTRWAQAPEKYQIEIKNMEGYFISFMDRWIKLLFPLSVWEPLPYKINGLSFQEFTRVTFWFAAQLEEAGILTNFSHILAAIAHSAELTPRELRDAAQRWFVTGDAEAVAELVARANRFMIRPR